MNMHQTNDQKKGETDDPRIAVLDALGRGLSSKRRDVVAARAASGIYSITNTVTGKQYIGSSSNLKARKATHWRQLRSFAHHSQKLQRSWDKHGEAAFIFRPVLLCLPKDLLMYEQILLDAVNPVRHGYNILPVAGSHLGAKRSAETRAKMSVIASNRDVSPETRAKMSKRMMGHKHSPDALERISAAGKARIKSPEWIAQMASREMSTETRAKISKTLMGHAVSDETRKKMSDAHIGREPRLPISEETRQRMRVAAQARCAKQAQRRAQHDE